MKKKIYITLMLILLTALTAISCGDSAIIDSLVSDAIQAGNEVLKSEDINSKQLITDVVSDNVLTDTVELESDMEKDFYYYYENVDICSHLDAFDGSYHVIDGTLIDYVGQEKLDEWIRYCGELDLEERNEFCSCPNFNIVSFVEYFNISREIFEGLLYSSYSMYYHLEYDPNVIYSRDEPLIQSYYTDKSRNNEFMKKRTEGSIKADLQYGVTPERCTEWIESKKVELVRSKNNSKFTGNIRQWSIAEYVKEFDISRETLEEIMALYKKNNHEMYDYDLDLIYSDDSRVTYMIAQNVDPIVIDSMYTSSDGIYKTEDIYETAIEKIQNGEQITIYDVVDITD